MQLGKTSDRELTLLRCLVHGDSGVGKTTSLRTLPVDKTLIVNVERGTVPLRKYDFTVLDVLEWRDVQELYRLASNPKPPENANKAAHAAIHRAKILAIDSLSEVSELCMKHIIQVDRRALVAERTKDKRQTPEGIYEEQMTQEDWGLYGVRMLRLVGAFTRLPFHIIMTCRSRWFEDMRGGGILRVPDFGGRQLPQKCPAYFDLVLHMESRKGANGENERVWRTYNDGTVFAKDASGELDLFEPTDWTALFAKVLSNSKGAK